MNDQTPASRPSVAKAESILPMDSVVLGGSVIIPLLLVLIFIAISIFGSIHIYLQSKAALRRQREERNRILFATLNLAFGALQTYADLSDKRRTVISPVDQLLKFAVDRRQEKVEKEKTERKGSSDGRYRKHHSY